MNICKFTEEQLYSCFTRVCIYGLLPPACHHQEPFCNDFQQISYANLDKITALINSYLCICQFIYFCPTVEHKRYISLNKYCKIAYKIMILCACFCTSLFKHLNDFTSGYTSSHKGGPQIDMTKDDGVQWRERDCANFYEAI